MKSDGLSRDCITCGCVCMHVRCRREHTSMLALSAGLCKPEHAIWCVCVCACVCMCPRCFVHVCMCGELAVALRREIRRYGERRLLVSTICVAFEYVCVCVTVCSRTRVLLYAYVGACSYHDAAVAGQLTLLLCTRVSIPRV